MNAISPFTKPVEWHEARRKGIGGSDANIIMSGNDEKLFRLWEEKTGRTEPEDLSRVLPVQMGTFTEPFNRYWYELTTGRKVTNDGDAVEHTTYSFMRCNLDGLTTTASGDAAVFEAKHVNPFGSVEEVVQRYMPQLHHSMACTGLDHAVLSILMGTQKYETYEVDLDDAYLWSLIDAEKLFWQAVETGKPPVHISAVEAPAITEYRKVDMSSSNAWCDAAANWIRHKDAAKKFDGAAESLKSLVEPDVNHASGHGVVITRSKSNALSIKETR